jgi:signal transduction histidine kinase
MSQHHKPDAMNILLIEDLPIYIRIISKILQNTHTTLEVAQSLAEALEKTQITAYDAILLDLGLPDSRGIDTFNSISSGCTATPIIILSSTDDETIAVQALKNGAQDYLIKGSYLTDETVGSVLLLRSISYAIERQRIQKELLLERSSLEQRVKDRTRELEEANLRLQNLATCLVSAQEDERRRISMELHDEAGQFLTALGLNLDLIRAEIETQSPSLVNLISEAKHITETIMSKLRSLAHDLRPPAIDTVGLSQALQDHCRKISRQTKLDVCFSAIAAANLPKHIQLSLYRVVQEALTNAIKHANASRIDISLESDAEYATLSVEDDGCGFNLPRELTPDSMGGIGLLGIEDRIEAIGGSLTISTQPGKGTSLFVKIPLPERP